MNMSWAGPVCQDDFQPGITLVESARARTKISINDFILKMTAKRKMF